MPRNEKNTLEYIRSAYLLYAVRDPWIRFDPRIRVDGLRVGTLFGDPAVLGRRKHFADRIAREDRRSLKERPAARQRVSKNSCQNMFRMP